MEERRRRRALADAERYLHARIAPPYSVIADPRVQSTSAGVDVVHFRHAYRGIPLFLASTSVHVDSERGTVCHAGDDPLPHRELTDVMATLDAGAAVDVATRHLHGRRNKGDACRKRHDGWGPSRPVRGRLMAVFALPSRPTVFSAGCFARAVKAELTIYKGILAWAMRLVTADRDEYLVLIGAARGSLRRVVYCQRVTSHATGRVFLFDPAGAQAIVDLPRALAVYPDALQSNAANVSFRWMDADATIGNNVETFWDGVSFRLRTAGNGAFPVAGDPVGKDQSVLNAFFFCNFMHDFFALLGFSDSDGSFHIKNVAAGGMAGDRLELTLLSQPLRGLGRTNAHVDGEPAELFLGRHPVTKRHAALEGAIVIHEYVHAITQRIIGGRHNPDALLKRQSRALAEAWSDFYAITIQNYYRGRSSLPEHFGFATWCAKSATGERRRLYDAGHLVTFGRAGRPPHDDDHTAGEIWAAAAIDFARRVVAVAGAERGYVLAWRTMLESFRRVPANPTWLAARDALLGAVADDAEADVSVLAAAREAFRIRGMGKDASSGSASAFKNIVESQAAWP